MSAKRVNHVLEYAGFGLLTLVVQLLPVKAAQRLGSALGGLAYRVLSSRRAITLDNLAKGLPELSPEKRVEIARNVFRGIATSFLEILWFPRLTPETLLDFARVENAHLVSEALAKGRGLIFLSAHFGNWEIGAQAVSVRTGKPMLMIVKPQSNPFVDRAVNRRRAQFGCWVVPMGESVRPVLKNLEAGGLVAVAADQSAAKQSIWVRFFGREVPVHQGPAAFALKTRAQIVMSFAVRQDDGTYAVTMKMLDFDDLVGYTPENVEELTRRHVQYTEEMIRRNPEQWMWTHRRWKTGPEEKPGRQEATDAQR